MISYTMIKEANPDHVKGSVAGAMNFMVFSLSACFAPVFGRALTRFSGGTLTLTSFHEADTLWAGAIVRSFTRTFFPRETGYASGPVILTAKALA
jgi:hypothetical protein